MRENIIASYFPTPGALYSVKYELITYPTPSHSTIDWLSSSSLNWFYASNPSNESGTKQIPISLGITAEKRTKSMTAHQIYITSIINAFSAFLKLRAVADDVREQSTLLLLHFLNEKQDFQAWEISELQAFLEKPAVVSQFSVEPKQHVMQFVKYYPPYQANVMVHEYMLALQAEGCSPSTIKNYRSDINQFLQYSHQTLIKDAIQKPKVVKFLKYQHQKSLKKSSVRRKLVSITQFAQWSAKQGFVEGSLEWLDELSRTLEGIENWNETAELQTAAPTRPQAVSTASPAPAWKLPLTSTPANAGNIARGTALKHQEFRTRLKNHLSALSDRVDKETKGLVLPYLNTAMIVLFVLGGGFFGYQQFIKNADSPFAYPTSLTRPNRTLSFQGRLTDTAKNPITSATNIQFKLYDSGPSIVGGNILWDSGACSVDPDQDGIFSTGLGSDCGSEITDDVFSENSNVWLQVEIDNGSSYEILEPRQSIKTVPYALNSETLQGYPASPSAVENTVVVMDNDGNINLGSLNPELRASSGTFTIEAQSLTLQTASGSNGDIVLAPDGTGQVSILSDLFLAGYLSAPGATLSATYAEGKALVVNGVAGQTANLTEWNDGDGNTTVVDEGGRIGIGTTNPSEMLQVEGKIRLADSVTLPNIIGSNTSAGLRINGDNLSLLGGSSGSVAFSVNGAGAGLNSGILTVPIVQTGYGSAAAPAFAFQSAGTDNGMFLPTGGSADSLGFSVGGTERIRIDADGEVGIGNTNPAYKLDVSGDINLTGALRAGGDAGTSGYLLTSAAGGANTWTDPSTIANAYSHWADALGAIYTKNITTDLLVGGTSTESAKFAVLNVNDGVPVASVSAGVSGAAYLTAGGVLGTTAGQDLSFAPSGATRMTISNNGNVGIGTTAPAEAFHLIGAQRFGHATETAYINATNMNYGTGSWLRFQTSGTGAGSLNGTTGVYEFRDSANALLTIGSTNNDSIFAYGLKVNGNLTMGDASGDAVTANASTWTFANDTNFVLSGGVNALSFNTDTFSVDATNGRIGIGTIAPDYKLDVAGDINLTGAIRLSGDAGTSGHFLTSGGGGAMTWTSPDNLGLWRNTDNIFHPRDEFAGVVDLAIGGNSTASASIRLGSNGDAYFAGSVGIGTTAPARELDVNGKMVVGNLNSSTSFFPGTDSTLYIDDSRELSDGGHASINSHTNLSLNTTSSNNFYAGLYSAYLSGSANGGTINGIYTQLDNDSTGTLTSMRGIVAAPKTLAGSGTVTNLTGGQFVAWTQGGTITNVRGILVSNAVSGSPTITNKTGITIDQATGATNNTNLLIGTTTIPAGTFSIYDASTRDSYFAGKMGIGTTAPTSLLHVTNEGDALTGKAAAIFDQYEGEDIIAASQSGSTKFRVDQYGSVIAGNFKDITNIAYYLDPAAAGTSLTVAGKAGIGTTSPGGMLHVVKSSTYNSESTSGIAITDADAYATKLNFGVDNAITASYLQSQHPSGYLPLLLNPNGGDVGIGTTAPAGKLHVVGTDSFFGSSTLGSSTAVNLSVGAGLHEPILRFQTNGTSRWEMYTFGTTNANPGKFGISQGNDHNSPAFLIDTDNNIGIGTLTPASRLNVLAAGSFTTEENLFMAQYNGGTGLRHLKLLGPTTDSAADHFTFQTGNAMNFRVDSTDALTINAVARVGVGATSPQAKLQVSGAVAGYPDIGEPTYGGLIITNTDSKYGTMMGVHSSGNSWIQNQRFDTNTTLYSLLLNPAGGNVGIGVTSTSQKLELSGNFLVQNSNFFQAKNSTGTAETYLWPRWSDNTMYLNFGSAGLVVRNNASAISMTISNTHVVNFAGNRTAGDAKYIYLGASNDLAIVHSGTASYVSNTNSPLFVGTTTAHNLVFRTSGTDRVRIEGPDLKVQNGGICAALGNDCPTMLAGEIRYDTSIGVYDLAEFYPSRGHLETGYVVTNKVDTTVESAKTNYDPAIIGVVSTNPNIVFGLSEDGSFSGMGARGISTVETNRAAIALAGRVPLRVSTANGPIQIGDALTSSTVTGHAMKATQAGPTIGKALTGFDPSKNIGEIKPCPAGTPAGVQCGEITVFVNTSWYDPDVFLNSAGQLTINGQNGDYQATNSGSRVRRIGAFAELVAAKIRAGILTTQELVVTRSASIANLSVDSLSIGGQTLRDYIASTVLQMSDDETATSSGELISPVATLENLEVTGDTLLANLLVTEDATFSGTLTAGTTKLGELSAQNATIEGTLTAETIIAATISAQSSRLAQLEAKMAEFEHIKATTAELITATVSGDLYADNIYIKGRLASSPSAPSIIEVTKEKLSGDTVASTGFSATSSSDLNLTLADLSLSTDDVTLTAQAGFINEYFKVNGSAYVANSLGVGNQLFIGQGTTIADGSIGYTAPAGSEQILHIQPSGKGTLSLMAGLLSLTEDGQVTITGDLNVAGSVRIQDTLLTNLIQPADFGNPFQVQVAGVDAATDQVKESRFEIINEMGTPVATISAEGRASFASGLDIGAEELSSAESEVDSTKSSGRGTLLANTRQLTIKSQRITANSLVYVTPVGSTQNQVLYVKSQQADNPSTPENEGQFVVGFDSAITENVNFNWWIVN